LPTWPNSLHSVGNLARLEAAPAIASKWILAAGAHVHLLRHTTTAAAAGGTAKRTSVEGRPEVELGTVQVCVTEKKKWDAHLQTQVSEIDQGSQKPRQCTDPG
jgi:hypothetical protein